tara:strand:- start:451 stop:969 length:519 start_codon:yes stop_codon:yes gene_type:complete
MKIDLFSIPIYISNIDVNKINLLPKKFDKTWLSETPSSIGAQNMLERKSLDYLLHEISLLLNITQNYKIKLDMIWENHYKDGDFQEAHAHAGSHFSFIIYKKIDESKTVFLNPAITLIDSYYENCKYNPIQTSFTPKCRQGQMIVFPSFLLHMVKKSNDCETIAGNVSIELT